MCSFVCVAQVADFEDLTLNPNSSWYGSADAEYFESSFLTLYNDYTEMYDSWQGFAYTNTTDAETFSYTNLSSVAGGGHNSENYVLGFIGMDWMTDYSPIPVSIKINTAECGNMENRGAYFCLSTYTSKYIDNGDMYATNHYYYKLGVSAYSNSQLIVSREIVMADFTDANSYKMDSWEFVDLSWIENADSVTFTAISNDAGEWGINTPAYFCIDDFGAENPLTAVKNITNINLDAYFDVNGELIINSDVKMLNVNVYDVAGRLLKSDNCNDYSTREYISNNGVYIISANTENGVISRKVVR